MDYGWGEVESSVRNMRLRFRENPGSVCVEEIDEMMEYIKSPDFSGTVSYDELYDVMGQLDTLRRNVVAYRNTGRANAYSFGTLEDSYNTITAMFDKLFTLITNALVFLWNLIKGALGRGQGIVPGYTARTLQGIKNIKDAYIDRREGEWEFQQYPDQPYENNHLPATVTTTTTYETDFDDLQVNPPLQVESVIKSNTSTIGAESSYWPPPSVDMVRNRRSPSHNSLENEAKSRLQNFGLVNGVGVNACFLNSLVQALRCSQRFVSEVGRHEAQHQKCGGDTSGRCVVCLVGQILAEMRGRGGSVERLRRALELGENSAEDPFEIFERVVNRLPPPVKRVFMLMIEDRRDGGNRLEVGMLDVDFVCFFRGDLGESLAHFVAVFDRVMAEPGLAWVEDTLAVYLDTYGAVSLGDYRAEIAELCRNPLGRALFGMRFDLTSFICSQNCGSIAHYVTFYYVQGSEDGKGGAWVYCNDLTVEICTFDDCIRKILDNNFYPKLLFFKKN